MDHKINYVGVSNMIWNKRIFSDKPEVVRDLKKSILEVGLIQPIVVAPTDNENTWRLIVGRKRYQAFKELYKESPNRSLSFCGVIVPLGAIPAVDIRNLDATYLINVEIAENVHRMDLSWQEKAAALATLHRVETERFEEKKLTGELPSTATYTISETAKKLASASGTSEATIRAKISRALIVADFLDDPDIARAESASAGFNNLKKKLTIQARIAGADYDRETQHALIENDCRQELVSQIANQYDLIFADPPYGIDANTYENMQEHKYEDSWDYAQTVIDSICHNGFRVAKDQAHLLLFCTPERWHQVRDIAQAAGWVPWFRPLVWVKSNEGMRPWGAKGFAYTYECIMWAVKGRKALVQTTLDVFSIYRPSPSEREHAAAKPLDLIKRLMEITCLPGDKVLDPCVGSGISFKAGTLLGLQVTGMENQPAVIPIARKNMYWDGKTEELDTVIPGADNLNDL